MHVLDSVQSRFRRFLWFFPWLVHAIRLNSIKQIMLPPCCCSCSRG